MPESHQRRNCFHTEFHLPNAAGKSRHGAPVRQIQSMPSSLSRWFLGGRPPREEAVVRKGAKITHSSSVISPPIIVDLKFTKRPVKIDRKSVNGIPRREKATKRIPDQELRFFSESDAVLFDSGGFCEVARHRACRALLARPH